MSHCWWVGSKVESMVGSVVVSGMGGKRVNTVCMVWGGVPMAGSGRWRGWVEFWGGGWWRRRNRLFLVVTLPESDICTPY